MVESSSQKTVFLTKNASKKKKNSTQKIKELLVKTISNNRWTPEEELLYYRFIRKNEERMNQRYFVKKFNKFEKMAQFISTKTISQCRSHHQKILQKYGNLEYFMFCFVDDGKKHQSQAIQVNLEKKQNETKMLNLQERDFSKLKKKKV